MVRVSIFKPCDMEYKQYNKPVRYSEEFLKELAMNTSNTKLVLEEHMAECIGHISNLTFTDGELFADVSTDHSLDNLSYSPSYDCTLIDKGEYWLATNGKLLEVALTSNPRKAILNNTAENGGSKMTDGNNDNETIKILNNQIKDLNKQLALAENKNKSNEEKLSKFDEMEKELISLRKSNEENSKIIEEQKPIIESFKKSQEDRKNILLDKISNDNSEIRAKLENMSVEDLETIAGLQTHEQPAKGVGASNAQGLNEGDGENDAEKQIQKDLELAKSMFSELKEE